MSSVTEVIDTGLQTVDIVRRPTMADRIVFAGGLPATGKSLITAVLGSLERVEIQKYNYSLEHICSVYELGAISEAAAVAMVRMMTDLDLYNMMMCRETNLRPSDMSSIFKNPRPFRYLRRLFAPGDAAAAERIRKEKPILQMLAHNLLLHSPLLFKALGDRLRVVEVVRHPLYMLKQWFLYVERYGTDARDFTICFEHEGRSLPFFVRGWEDLYVRSNAMDKVIHSIDQCFRRMEALQQTLPESSVARSLFIPFEPFVLDPAPWLKKLETLVGTQATGTTRKELKKQRVPRRMVAEGKSEPIYRKYGWEPPSVGATERTELLKRRAYAAEHATPEGLKTLDRICAWYEEKFWQPE